MSTSRFPNYLPSNPSFWMDAKRDISVPSSGSNIKSPANLAGFSSDELAEQTSSNNQPSWNGSEWKFESGDFWTVKNVPITEHPNNMIFVAVFEDLQTSSINGIYQRADADNQPNLGLDSQPTQTRVRSVYQDDEGQTSGFLTLDVDPTVGKVISVGSYEGLNEGDITHELLAQNKNGRKKTSQTKTTSAGFAIDSNAEIIGATEATGVNANKKKIFELMKFHDNLPEDDIIQLMDFLSDKWSV